ncbi:hemicentin-1-like isoform X2 [Mytilus trossulus]|uniref:hemicentin-1-like isoform X2 n=1 Tax=Mytilus trossulus TaxID=6551 RepID=UPI003007A0DF
MMCTTKMLPLMMLTEMFLQPSYAQGIPVVQILQSSYQVNFGSSRVLECTVSSNPAHSTVQWQKLVNNQFQPINFANNKYEGSSVSIPSLTVNSADLNDEGFYICTATNSLGIGQSSQTFLDVIGNILTVTIQQSQYSVTIGQTVTLGCTVTGSPAATNVYWQKTVNNVVTTISSNTNTNKYSGSIVSTPSLTIVNADQSDEATYVCFATNGVGLGQSTQTFLDVTGNAPSVQVQQPQYNSNFGSTVTLVCTVTANPAHTTVQWQRVINSQRSNINVGLAKYTGSTVGTPSLTINNVELSDEGNYVCTATNSIGTGESTQTFLDVVGNLPNVVVTLQQYNVDIGSTVTLGCTVTASPTHTVVYWQRIGNNNVGTTVDMNNIKYSGSTVNSPSLTINNAALSDEGSYRCYATNSIGLGQSQNTFLDVVGTVPTVQVQQPSYSVTTGGSVTLGCTVTSNLAVTDVYWQRNVGSSILTIRSTTNTNKYSGITTGTPSLTIFNADQNDVATYTCFASNSVGTGQSTTTQLSVTGTVSTVQVQQPSYSVTTGSSVTLVCTVTSTLTVNNVYWQRNNGGGTTQISTNTNKYSGSIPGTPSLTIFNANQSDVGTYTCFATNSVGTGQSTTTTLSVTGTVPTVQVQQPSYSVTTGSSVTLACTVTSTLTVNNVYWQRNNGGGTTQISTNTNKYSGSIPGTPSLTIFNADQSDVATYTCFASNSVGTGQSTTTQLSVIGTPPTVIVPQPSYSITIGDSITLVCNVTSNLPVTSVQWERNIGGSVTTITSTTNTNKYSGSTPTTPSLTIFNGAQSNSGDYTCFATNSVGTGQSTGTTLSVTGNAPVVTITQPSYSVNFGGTITITCTISADPAHNTVYWQKVGVSQSVTIGNRYTGSTVSIPSLTISNALHSDEGFYVCYATNSVGTGNSQQTFLDVQGIL